MKEMDDDELQEQLQRFKSGNINPDIFGREKDLALYTELFRILSAGPAIPMTHNFSGRVTATIQARKERLNVTLLYLLLGMGFISLLAAALLYLESFSSGHTSQLLAALIKYKWEILFGGAVLLVIQMLDRKLVQHH